MIDLQTWDQIDRGMTGGDADPDGVGGGVKSIFKSMTALGALDAALYKGTDTAGAPNFNGDLIELGYYQVDGGTPNVDGTNLFVGTWTPLTTKTTIGARFDESGTGWENLDSANAGEFYYQIAFTRNSDDLYSNTAQINPNSHGDHQESDNVTGLGGTGSGHLYKLDFATHGAASGAEARLGIRVYDISQTANTGWNGSNKSLTATKYQTIMHADWKWDVIGGDTGASMVMDLHETDGTPTSTLKFEFDNTDARGTNVSKVGTNDMQLMADDFVTTIAYHTTTGNLDVSDSGLGSAIVSGFTSSGNVVGANDGNVFTINSAAGNTGNNAYDFSGNIYQNGSTSTDLTIVKAGGGEQILSGNVNASDSNNAAASAYLDIQEGTVILKPASGKTQKFEYLTGASSGTRALTLDNSDEGTQAIELGFANTSDTSTQTFSGAVTLQGSGSANVIKVVSDTAKNNANYGKEQVLSGIVSGSETLTKSGLGRLMLSGDNTFDGGGTDVIINDGTLVAAHADALGGASTTVVINKGKLEIGDGNNGAVTLHTGTTLQGSASGKSMVGGDGTITNLTVGDGSSTGSAATDVNVISPGRGISSSLSSNTSQQQVSFGGGGAAAKVMGELTVTNLTLNPGAVFDWEITDFDGGNGDAGEDWDILNFSNLDFTDQGSSTFSVNVFSVAADGTAGKVTSTTNQPHTGTNGILFMDGANHAAIDWGSSGDYTLNNSGWQHASYFNVDSDPYNYHNGGLNGGWSVWYNGSGDFYLRYSAVPEPSTYVMVLGMLLVPGFRFFRRFRKGIKEEDQ